MRHGAGSNRQLFTAPPDTRRILANSLSVLVRNCGPRSGVVHDGLPCGGLLPVLRICIAFRKTRGPAGRLDPFFLGLTSYVIAIGANGTVAPITLTVVQAKDGRGTSAKIEIVEGAQGDDAVALSATEAQPASSNRGPKIAAVNSDESRKEIAPSLSHSTMATPYSTPAIIIDVMQP
jgi:hypothetical protein